MEKKNNWSIYWNSYSSDVSLERVINKDRYYRLLKRLISLPTKYKIRIAEIGCGSGMRSLALAKEFKINKNIEITLLDASRSSIALAKKIAKQNKVKAHFVIADALKIPFKSNYFDIVWNEGVNEHFSGTERQQIFNEMVRICKKGGQVVVIVPNAFNPFYRFAKAGLTLMGRWIYGFEDPFTFMELKRRLEKAGIRTTVFSGVGIIASIFDIFQLFSNQHNSSASPKKNTYQNKSLKTSRVDLLEKWLELRVGHYLARDIGIGGIKI